MIVGHIGGAGSPYEIQKSLRFRASASAYLSRTPSVSGNRKTWTWSGWVKRGILGVVQVLMSSDVGTSVNTWGEFGFDASDKLYFSSYSGVRSTTALFRDPSASYHIQIVFDTTQGVEADRIKFYVNGVRQTQTGDAGFPALNTDYGINNTQAHDIGRRNWASGIGRYFDGYLSEINFIDGQALDPSYFGQVSAETGAWIPKKYTGTYGTNGFYLPFNDGSTLANLTADRSGNGNNWTANNISLTAGSSYDWMDDTPTNNFAVLNPIDRSNASLTVSAGNLDVSTFATFDVVRSSFTLSSGKWYWETTGTSTYTGLGVSRMDVPVGSSGHTTANGWYVFADTGNKWTNNSGSAYISGGYSGTDVIGIALDCDAGTITFYKNNTSQGTAFTGLAGLPLSPGVTTGLSVSTAKLNFGQRPFAYSPPAGFKALCTKNLPTPSILNPKKHFDALTYTGTGAVRSITGLGFTPDLVWMKSRGSAQQHMLQDSVRGATQFLSSNLTTAEATNVNTLTSFDSGGFTLGSEPAVNQSATAFAGWTWKAGGAPATNNAGSIQSQVSANPQAGFSIVTYTGTGANATVGHGLGVVPKMVIVKTRSVGSYDWCVHHANLTSASYYLSLSGTIAQTLSTNVWNATAPTSSVVSIGTSVATNQNAQTLVMYCFAEIPGYSKIGSYTGNGSADGPFVYCGFRPRYVLIKRVDAVNSWGIIDAARSGSNSASLYLLAESAASEQSDNSFDILSNGFKCRLNGALTNASGSSYIFYAVAEQPFKFANAR